MNGLLEAVPNFSEGRDRSLIDAIAAAVDAHARVLDVHADGDHNRCVVTCVGEADALADGVAAGVAVAVERIDLGRHRGVHPRVGAADVLPVVRFAAGDPGPPRSAARLAEAVGALGVPVFGYGELGGGRRPAFYRAGGPQRLAERLAAGELAPIAGPAALHPTAGAALVGVREPLVAFNLELEDADLELARAVAAAVRARDGGLPGLQAIGLALESSGRAQVSMNLIDTAATPLWRVVEEVSAQAQARGARVAGGELVGLIPARVAWEAAARGLRLADRRPDRVLETAVGGEFGI